VIKLIYFDARQAAKRLHVGDLAPAISSYEKQKAAELRHSNNLMLRRSRGAGSVEKERNYVLYIYIWVCLKMGYTPNYSHLVGIMIINHWV